MSTRIQVLEERYEEASQEVKKFRERRAKHRRISDRQTDNIHDLRDVAEKERDDRKEARSRLIVVQKRLEVIEGDGFVDEEEQAQWNDLMQRKERLVDEAEESTDIIQRCLARIAELDPDRDRHNDLQRHFGNELEIAIARKRRIEREIEEAKRDAENSPLGTDMFVVSEFDCKCGTRIVEFCPYIIPHLKAMVQGHLLPLRRAYGRPVRITSALRPGWYNAQIGGASNSYHCYEARKSSPAVDHTVDGTPASQVQQWHENNNPFDGMGFYAGFTHGDDRGYRSRWYGAG